mgnify:CR=1 FL=1
MWIGYVFFTYLCTVFCNRQYKMIQNQRPPIHRIAFPILIALSISHCLNDMLQSVISAVYPLFKEDLSLSFAQIGLITLVYQMSASVFQPLMGLFFDKRPIAWSLPIGMGCWLRYSLWVSVRLYSIRRRHVLLFWLPAENADWRSLCFKWVGIWEARLDRYWWLCW